MEEKKPENSNGTSVILKRYLFQSYLFQFQSDFFLLDGSRGGLGLEWVNFMADKNDKYSDNVPGPYYVDRSCIDCAACNLTAPDHFLLDEDDGHAYVVKQPENPDEEELCEEAMLACPVESIGKDGEGVP